ncbi:hypothetical protein GGQ22_11555 [Nocardioides sp. zg-579]|uniref:Uncharacterized protein n=1 Tax=Nocardioides marmotae TaxID=2663857 RepID=A0A6I3JC31_9ACTN|nr:hypothetical protein [Nocardioides marmotae]MTB95722.1 hypothetical protein [Nocardioides marmotae]QKE01123.1 hypothetical protein HPC71_08615 [Nocardioides marmotae]
MTVDAAPREQTYDVPTSAWVLAWASVVMQLTALAERGAANGEAALISVPLSALVVAWFSAGVIRARMVRTWLAGIVLLLVTIGSVVDLVTGPPLLDLVGTAAAVAAFAAFVSYVRSDCFAALRADRDASPSGLGGLVAVAILVGALGGLIAPLDGPDQGPGVHLRIGL